MKKIPSYILGSSNIEALDLLYQPKKMFLTLLREKKLQKSQQNMKRHADSYRTNFKLNEVDWVYLKLQSFSQNSLA